MYAPVPNCTTDLQHCPEGNGVLAVQTLDASIMVQLPTDNSGCFLDRDQCYTITFDLPPDLTTRLRQYRVANTDDLAVTLLAAFAVFLNRYTREDQLHFQLCVHTPPSSVRQADGTHQIVVPLDLDLSVAPLFAQLIPPIVACVDHPEQAAAAPAPPVADSEPRVAFRYRHLDNILQQNMQPASDSMNDLCLEILDDGTDIQIAWTYSSMQFEAATVVRMHQHWRNLLLAITVDHTRPITRLPLLNDTELQQQIYEWNATATSYPATCCIHHLFEEQALSSPDAPALSSGPVVLSYKELNWRANQLAHYIQQLGGGPEMLIGLHMDRSFEMFIGILGILKAGCAYLPLDPEYPQDRLTFMLSDASVLTLLTTSQLVDNVTESFQKEIPRLQIICLDSDWPIIAQQVCENPDSQVTPDNLAYVIYTSGSTGRPKGTQLAHRGLCNLAMAQQQTFSLGLGEHVLQFASCSFDASVWEWVMALTSGSTLHIARQETLRSLTDLTMLLHNEAITLATLPPSLLALLPNDRLPSLHTVITAGEACTTNLVSRWAKGRRLYNAYGPTESTICASWYHCGANEIRNPPIGRPLPNMQLFILDKLGQPVPLGVPGELHIGGFSLARGYLNQPKLTAERFIDWTINVAQWSADESSPASLSASATTLRLYKTGDLARFLPDGNIEFLGRIDDQVKLRGFRIELGEIEAVLRQHPSVCDTVVQLREDAPGVRRLVAYLITRFAWHNEAMVDGQVFAQPIVEDLQAYLRERLPEYMLPAQFVYLHALPLTLNGKVDRRKLPPPQLDDAVQQGASASRTRDEHMLASIWAQVLGIPQIGINDDFFALGGHSLAAAHAVTLVGQQLGKAVPLRLIYAAPTVASFTQAMARLSTGINDISADELTTEVVLDREITPTDAQPAYGGEPRKILLTGATGFLGAFLLQELLKRTRATIYCLVRADSDEIAASRLVQTLDTYNIDVAACRERIIPLVGDLSVKRLGLAEPVFQRMASTLDVIYHPGANVHYLHPYANLKAANVDGTVEVIRLACLKRIKPLHYISTIAVAIAQESSDPVREDAPLGRCHSTKGYDQSKWVAEGILHRARARGLPVSIYRPGRITGHTQTGAFNSRDFFIHMLSGCLQLGLAPRLPLVENLVPIDYIVQAIVHLSQQVDQLNRTFHLLSPYLTCWGWVVATTRMLGYELEEISYQEWHRELMRVAPESFGQVFHNLLLTMPPVPAPAHISDGRATHYFDMHNTIAGLATSGITCTSVDRQMLERMLAYGRQHQLFMRGEYSSGSQANKPVLVPQQYLCSSGRGPC